MSLRSEVGSVAAELDPEAGEPELPEAAALDAAAPEPPEPDGVPAIELLTVNAGAGVAAAPVGITVGTTTAEGEGRGLRPRIPPREADSPAAATVAESWVALVSTAVSERRCAACKITWNLPRFWRICSSNSAR